MKSLACLSAANASDLFDAPAGHCYDTEFESECFDFSATHMGSRPALAVCPMTLRDMQPVQQDDVLAKALLTTRQGTSSDRPRRL